MFEYVYITNFKVLLFSLTSKPILAIRNDVRINDLYICTLCAIYLTVIRHALKFVHTYIYKYIKTRLLLCLPFNVFKGKKLHGTYNLYDTITGVIAKTCVFVASSIETGIPIFIY